MRSGRPRGVSVQSSHRALKLRLQRSAARFPGSTKAKPEWLRKRRGTIEPSWIEGEAGRENDALFSARIEDICILKTSRWSRRIERSLYIQLLQFESIQMRREHQRCNARGLKNAFSSINLHTTRFRITIVIPIPHPLPSHAPSISSHLIPQTHSHPLPNSQNPHFPPTPSANLKLTLLTQCRSSVGVGYPSPLKTWPRWPPHLLQVISVRDMPSVESVWRVTAPGRESK